MIDFHCHLDLFPDPVSVADRCEKEQIYVLSVTTTPSAWSGTKKLERARIRTALGLHPQIAHQRKTELSLFDLLLPKTRYVGEIGLDGAPEFKEHWDDQLCVFRHILGACTDAGGRIMSIHSRRASRAVLDEIQAHPDAGTPILHWFSGSSRELDQAIECGCWFSVGPPMLRSQKGRALIERMPRGRILTESDGPFAQVDNHPAMPWDAELAIQGLADLWSLEITDARDIVLNNLKCLAKTAPLTYTAAEN